MIGRHSDTYVQRTIFLGDDKSFSKATKNMAKDLKEVDHSMSKTGKAFQAIGVSGVGRGFGDLKQALGAFSRGNLSYGVSSLSRAFSGLNAAGRGAYAAIGVATAAITGLVAIGIKANNVYQNLAKTLQQMSRISGLKPGASLEVYGQLKMSGADIQSASKMLGMFGKNVEMARQGTGKQAKAMQMLGVSLKDATGKYKAMSELLPEVRNAIAKTTDAATRDFAAQTMFGRGWQTMGKWFNASAKDIQHYNKIVAESGFTWGKKDTAGYKDLLSMQREISLRWELLLASMGKTLMPYVKKIIKLIVTIGPAFLSGFKAGVKAIGLIGAPLAWVVKAIDSLFPSLHILSKLAYAFGALVPFIVAAAGALAAFVTVMKVVTAYNASKLILGWGASWGKNVTAIDRATASIQAQQLAYRNEMITVGEFKSREAALNAESIAATNKAAAAKKAGFSGIAQQYANESALLRNRAKLEREELALLQKRGTLPVGTSQYATGPVYGVKQGESAMGTAALTAEQLAGRQAFADATATAVVKEREYQAALRQTLEINKKQIAAGMPQIILPGAPALDKAALGIDHLGAAAGATSGQFAALGASIRASLVSLGPWLIAIAAIGAAFILVKPFYDDWKAAESELAKIQTDNAAALGTRLDKLIEKYGILGSKTREISTINANDILSQLNEKANQNNEVGGGSLLDRINPWKQLGNIFDYWVGGDQAGKAAKAVAPFQNALNELQKAANAGALGDAGRKAIQDDMEILKGLGPVGAEALAYLQSQLAGFGSAAEAAAAKLKAALDAMSTITLKGPAPLNQVLTTTKAWAQNAGLLDKDGNPTGGWSIVEDVQKTAAETAAAGADLAKTLASIPKNIVQILNRDWVGIGAAFNRAMIGFNAGMSAGMSDETVAALAARVGNLASIASAIGTVMKTLADAPKKAITLTRQNYGALAAALSSAMTQIMAVFAKVGDDLLKKDADRLGNIGTAAGGVGSFISALADMPKKAVTVTRQNWTALANALAVGLREVLDVFAADKGLAKSAARAGSVGSAAGGIGSFISAIADMPAKAIKWVPQRFHALGVALQSAMNDILSVFSGTGTKQLATEATRAGSIGSISSAIAGMFTSFADITESSAQQALDGVKAARSKAKDMAAQIVGLVSDFQKAMKPLKVSEAGATKFGRVQTITSGVATIIGDFADMTAASIDKAVAAMQYVAEKKAPLIAGAMHDVVVALQAQFLKMDLGKNFADTTDRITTIVSNIAGLLGTFADMTAASIDKAVDVMKYIAEQKAPDIGAAMKDMIVGIAKGIGDYSVDDALVTVTEKITGIAQNIASTLTQFGTLTKAGIDTAITNMRYAAQNANVLAGAMVDMAKALKSAFDDAGVDAAYADATDAIGRVMDTLSKVMDFASGMTEDMIGKIKTFVQLAPANEDLWTQVGSVLARMITLVTDALGIIPDTTALTQAEAAISTLTSIFDAMTGLTDSISKAAAWVSPTTTDTTSANYTPTPVAAMAASGNSTNVNVNVSWSTLTGEPSAREKRQLVASLKPELDRVNAAKTRTGF